MADYIYPAPGLTSAALTLRVYHTSKAAEAALSTPTTGASKFARCNRERK